MNSKLQHTNPPITSSWGEAVKYSWSGWSSLHHWKAAKMSQTTPKSPRPLQFPRAFLSDLFHSPVPCRGRRQGRFQSRLCSLICGWAESWGSKAEAGWSRGEGWLRRVKINFVMAPFPPLFLLISFSRVSSSLLEKGTSLGRAVKPLSFLLSLSRDVFPLTTDCSDIHQS